MQFMQILHMHTIYNAPIGIGHTTQCNIVKRIILLYTYQHNIFIFPDGFSAYTHGSDANMPTVHADAPLAH
jgi:hypothetical protein